MFDCIVLCVRPIWLGKLGNNGPLRDVVIGTLIALKGGKRMFRFLSSSTLRWLFGTIAEVRR